MFNHFVNLLLSGSLFLLAFLIIANANKVNKKGNQWFGVFLVLFFLITIENTFAIIGIKNIHEVFNQTINLSCLIIAPVFYFSVCYFVNPKMKWKPKHFVHFVFGIFISLILLLLHLSTIFHFNFPKNHTINAVIVNLISYSFIGLFVFQIVFYGYFSYIKIKKHQSNIVLFSSNIDKINLKWLEKIVFGMLLLSIVWSVDILFDLSNDNFSLINLMVLIIVFYIAYYSTNQKELFAFNNHKNFDIIEIIEEANLKIDDKKKLLSDDKLNEIKSQLETLMHTQKIFLDNELNLIKLAAMMNVSIHHLSYVINTSFNKNFFLYVNDFRIEEAKKMILDPNMDYLSILGIGFEVGFNSKSVFNTTFKKATGQTPSQFKKQQQLLN